MFTNPKASKSRGFSVPEIIVVCGIIVLLTAITFGSIVSSRKKARDVQRISDLKEIQFALALYHDLYREYPGGNYNALEVALESEGFIPEMPKDPLTLGDYEYKVENSTGKYCLGVTLESNIPEDTATCTSRSGQSYANYKVQP